MRKGWVNGTTKPRGTRRGGWVKETRKGWVMRLLNPEEQEEEGEQRK